MGIPLPVLAGNCKWKASAFTHVVGFLCIKNNMKNTFQKIKTWITYRHILIVILLLILGLMFYWFELRPSQTKTSCAKYAYKENSTSDNMFNPDGFNGTYSLCLHLHGI
jgi:L-asparagine transporter-like permease